MAISFGLQPEWPAPSRWATLRERLAAWGWRGRAPAVPGAISPEIVRLPEHLLMDLGLEPHMVQRPGTPEATYASLRYI